MPAAGKDNAAGIAAKVGSGKTVRILITDNTSGKHASPAVLAGDTTPTRWYPSSVKTKVVTATVTDWSAVAVGAGRRSSRRYTLHTDKGDVDGLAPIETLWLAPEPKPTPAADVTAVEVDGTVVAFTRHVDLTTPAKPEPEPTTPVIARRSTMQEARRHFEAGGSVLVSEHGHKETRPVGRDTTTHNKARITWDELTAMVDEWRNRYPNQRFYIVPAADTEPAPERKPEPVEDAGHRTPNSLREGDGVYLTSDMRPATKDATGATVATFQRAVKRDDEIGRFDIHTDAGVVENVHGSQRFRLAAPGMAGLVGKWLTRRDGTVGQVRAVFWFRAALGGEDCTDLAYEDTAAERYLTRDLPAPLADDEARKVERRIGMWAARFMAETVCAEPPRPMEPTDEALAEAFAYSTLAENLSPLYPAIRAEIRRQLAEREATAEPAYAVGDRVTVLRGDRPQTGIVAVVHTECGPDVFYEVRMIPAGLVPVSEDELSPAAVPEPGQRWIAYSGGKKTWPSVVTVVGPASDHPDGLVTDCEEVRGVLLGAPHWRPLDESDPVEVAFARTDALMRRPEVFAILKRARQLTDDERALLDKTCRRNFELYRTAHIQLGHHIRKAWGENFHDLTAVCTAVWRWMDGDNVPTFLVSAVEDMVLATLAREHLSENEYRIFAGPWLDVIGG